jgi:hypothetical protein
LRIPRPWEGRGRIFTGGRKVKKEKRKNGRRPANPIRERNACSLSALQPFLLLWTYIFLFYF